MKIKLLCLEHVFNMVYWYFSNFMEVPRVNLWESVCLHMHDKVHFDWLLNYIKIMNWLLRYSKWLNTSQIKPCSIFNFPQKYHLQKNLWNFEIFAIALKWFLIFCIKYSHYIFLISTCIHLCVITRIFHLYLTIMIKGKYLTGWSSL